MFKFEILKINKGAIISYILVFVTIFLVLLAGLIGFIAQQLKAVQQRIAWHEALNIAEAGIEYYKWCLNNNIEDCPLEKEYKDTADRVIGKFQIQADSTAICGKVVSQKIISTGYTLKFPKTQRKISVFYGTESVAKYAYILNTHVWVGSDHIIRGPFHSNGGIRFDGQNLSTISSAKNNWVCTESFGCQPPGEGEAYGFGICPSPCQVINQQCVCPGIFSTSQNSKQDLFLYPEPPFDFTGILVDLYQIKKLTTENGLGLYFGPSGAFGYRILINENNLKVWKVTEVNWLTGICTVVNEETVCDGDKCTTQCPECQGNKCVLKEPTIKSESLIYDDIIPAGCGLIFFEDNLWIGREDQESRIKGKLTIASANLINPNQKTDVWIQGNINYATSGEETGLLIISQHNLLLSLYSPNIMNIQGIFVAQTGFFGRNYYPCSKFSPYCLRERLEIKGSIVSSGRVGAQWVQNPGGNVTSGYLNRETYQDKNLIFNPPLFTPSLDSRFKIIHWEEL